MAFLAVEDILEAVEVIVFPKTFACCEETLDSTDPIIVQGKLQNDEHRVKIIADAIYPLQEAREKFTELIKIRLDADKVNRQKLDQLKKLLYYYHGDCPLLLTLNFKERGEVDIDVQKELTLRPCRELTDKIKELLGYQAMSYRKQPVVLQDNGRGKRNFNGKGFSGAKAA